MPKNQRMLLAVAYSVVGLSLGFYLGVQKSLIGVVVYMAVFMLCAYAIDLAIKKLQRQRIE